MSKIRKAIFPVGGLGTRFLPATKAIPKEMLTVLDRPLIQHVVDEAREAGIEEFIFVTGRNKGVIEDHFDFNYELEDTLIKRGKSHIVDTLRTELPAPGKAVFIRQQAPLGLGHAILCARDVIGDESFAVMLPDVLIKSDIPCTKQLMDLSTDSDTTFIAVEKVPQHQVSSYGIIAHDKKSSPQLNVTDLVEKPEIKNAPSNLAITGRYILPPQIFKILQDQKAGSGGEIQLTDAIQKLIATTSVSALEFEGTSFDCGSKPGFVMANLAYALDQEEMHSELIEEFIRLKLRTKIDAMLDQNAIIEMTRVLKSSANK